MNQPAKGSLVLIGVAFGFLVLGLILDVWWVSLIGGGFGLVAYVRQLMGLRAS